ncbi:MAG: MoaD/ThiS family protein [Dehalococcoidia bacterium]|nr:MoaD/ThiS family protein [Dehalococcoidia bacterium]
MAMVIIPAALREMCAGMSKVEVPGANIGEVLREINARYPGFYERVVESGRIRPELAIAMDGEILSLALHDAVGPNAEIAIVPAIGGGA